MDALEASVRAYLDQIGCKYKIDEEEDVTSFAIRGENGSYPVYVYARDHFLVTISRYTKAIPDRFRLEVAEYLHRINHGILLGNFEMDYDAGEIRFRTCLVVDDRAPSAVVLDRYIQTPALLLDHYVVGINAILYEGEIASLACALVQEEE